MAPAALLDRARGVAEQYSDVVRKRTEGAFTVADLDALQQIAKRELKFQNVGIRREAGAFVVDDACVTAFCEALKGRLGPQLVLKCRGRRNRGQRIHFTREESTCITMAGLRHRMSSVTSLAGKEKLLCEASLAAIEHQNQIVDAMFERDRVAKRAWRADRTRGRRTTENLVESSTALSA